MSKSPAEVIAACLRTFAGPVFDDAVARIVFGQNATHLLAALEDAGWRLFRPGDCETVTVEDQGTSKHDGYVEGWYPAGIYWLVEKEDNE